MSHYCTDIFCRYKVNDVGSVHSDNISGLLINFEPELESKVTRFRVDFKTFITRIGGIVGVWKNLFWIIIFFFASVAKLISIVARYHKNNNK